MYLCLTFNCLWNDVKSISVQRHDMAPTSIRRFTYNLPIFYLLYISPCRYINKRFGCKRYSCMQLHIYTKPPGLDWYRINVKPWNKKYSVKLSANTEWTFKTVVKPVLLLYFLSQLIIPQRKNGCQLVKKYWLYNSHDTKERKSNH